MQQNVNSSLRKRGILGALIGVTIPYAHGVYLDGLFLGDNPDLWIFYAIICGFCGVFGAGIATRNFGHGLVKGSNIDQHDDSWVDHDRDRREFQHQSGMYAYMRDGRD